ncbi:unnamed protein product (macronuclear) [Paramecium tetraurelia]|uniref:Transmembrane protein n=1 Tax=Paramecium tetraurelia TaxID=5888 RepID=A0DFU8_PARTE|nr:uncharacterized protein GSPATT00039477001 [Paramecium tetraurelia]CAK81915.1 unnamed protein product [Paramecium tetraurelia]|eukprot:XP_001449312.1 hypothetical protein (macronuclear) [Paramecium tetraurelia strain d4-2]
MSSLNLILQFFMIQESQNINIADLCQYLEITLFITPQNLILQQMSKYMKLQPISNIKQIQIFFDNNQYRFYTTKQFNKCKNKLDTNIIHIIQNLESFGRFYLYFILTVS